MEKTTQVIAWMLAATFGIVVLLSTYDAHALTLKSGEVYTKDGVMKGNETASAKAQLADKGYHVSAGILTLDLEDTLVEIDLKDLAGKSKAEVKEIIKDAAITAFDAEGAATDITADIVNGGALDATLGNDAIFNNMTEAAVEAYESKLDDMLAAENGMTPEEWAESGNAGGRAPQACDPNC